MFNHFACIYFSVWEIFVWNGSIQWRRKDPQVKPRPSRNTRNTVTLQSTSFVSRFSFDSSSRQMLGKKPGFYWIARIYRKRVKTTLNEYITTDIPSNTKFTFKRLYLNIKSTIFWLVKFIRVYKGTPIIWQSSGNENLVSNNGKVQGSISVTGRLPTYPSPNPTLTLTCYQSTIFELGEG